AARYQFVYRGCVQDYLPGQDPRWYRFSVGLVLVSHCVEYAILNGDQEVNLLRGAETYKMRWAAYSDRQRVLTATKPMTRAWLGLKTSQASSSIRRLVKQVLPAMITTKIQTSLRTASKIRRQRMERKYV